ncbi:hypothetical protein D9C11_18320 [Bacillus subtilis subsp. subtilis]|nr:hypothetical protein D9C11_18320 [Bacillus subtilis subsp. subtilis]
MGALFLHLKPDEYLKKLYKTKKLVEKTSFSLQAEKSLYSALLCIWHPKICTLLVRRWTALSGLDHLVKEYTCQPLTDLLTNKPHRI